jgi:hypothetical protein
VLSLCLGVEVSCMLKAKTEIRRKSLRECATNNKNKSGLYSYWGSHRYKQKASAPSSVAPTLCGSAGVETTATKYFVVVWILFHSITDSTIYWDNHFARLYMCWVVCVLCVCYLCYLCYVCFFFSLLIQLLLDCPLNCPWFAHELPLVCPWIVTELHCFALDFS